jgi:hypothetical protein
MFGTNYNDLRADMGYQPKSQSDADDWFYRRCLGGELKFAIWPRRCDISNKLIWFKYGYRLIAILTGPGDDIIEYRWHDKIEHIIWQLKRNENGTIR